MSKIKVEQIEGIDTSTYAGKAIKSVKTKLRGIMGDEILTMTLIDFVSFMLLNNKFANKGIFITHNNKEEKYIEIIETCDEELINDLEKYIILLDKLKEIEIKKEEYCNIVDSLKSLNDYNDRLSINSIIEEYLRR